jgi:hypothetical protein
MVGRVPPLLQDAVFDGDQAQLAVRRWLKDKRLRLVRINLPRLDQVSVGVMDAHCTNSWIINTCDPGCIFEERVPILLCDGERMVPSGCGTNRLERITVRATGYACGRAMSEGGCHASRKHENGDDSGSNGKGKLVSTHVKSSQFLSIPC